MSKRIPKLAKLRGGGIVLVVAIAILGIEYFGMLGGVDNAVYDLFFRLRGSRQPPSAVIVVAIDESSLAVLGRWPLKRRLYADLLTHLDSAAAVGFDLAFAESTSDDQRLAAAIDRHGRVVLPVHFRSRGRAVLVQPLFTSRAWGHVHIEPGVDGIVRDVFHRIAGADRSVTSLAASLCRIAGDAVLPGVSRPTPRPPQGVPAGCLLQQQPMKINFYGPPGTFERVGLSDVLSAKIPTRYFKQRIVLVGVTAVGVGDRLSTPFSQQRHPMPGVEVQANIVANRLDGSDVKEVSSGLRMLLGWLAAGLFGWACTAMSGRAAFLAWLLMLAAISGLCFGLFARACIWLRPAGMCLAVSGVWGLVHLLRLDNSIRRLDGEYRHLVAQVRWPADASNLLPPRRGIRGMLSAGGVHRRIDLVAGITRQLLFEKILTDSTLFSDVHGIALFDAVGRLRIANRRAKDLFQRLPITSTELFTVLEALGSRMDPPAQTAELLDHLEKSTPGITRTVVLGGPQAVYYQLDIAPMILGPTRYLIFVFADISRVKEAEILKDEMVSTVSHELKQPLTAIQGFSELLLEQVTAEGREYATIIHRESRRMATFIQTFLDVTRLESGRVEIRPIAVNVGAMLIAVAGTLKPLADQKHIRVLTNTSPLGLTLTNDERLLRQCVLNLLENAIKYSPPHSSIQVDASIGDGGVLIEVADGGPGIEPAELEKIFDKFYRGTAVSDSPNGSGLGLAFVRQSVHQLGGTVEARNREPAGSSFCIRLPAGN